MIKFLEEETFLTLYQMEKRFIDDLVLCQADIFETNQVEKVSKNDVAMVTRITYRPLAIITDASDSDFDLIADKYRQTDLICFQGLKQAIFNTSIRDKVNYGAPVDDTPSYSDISLVTKLYNEFGITDIFDYIDSHNLQDEDLLEHLKTKLLSSECYSSGEDKDKIVRESLWSKAQHILYGECVV